MNAILSNFIPISTKLTPAAYLADIITQQHIKTVGIWGPSGGGKTTFSRALSESVGVDMSLVWKIESYWQYTRPQMAELGLTGYHWETRDKQRFLNDFERVKAGYSVECPVFDNIREVPTNQTVMIVPKDVIILEDTLDFSEIVDLGVFMYAPDEVLVNRRIERDADQTGLGNIAELETYVKTKSLPTYKAKLLPSISSADYILDTHEGILYKKR